MTDHVHQVAGVRSPRPFKIRRLGHIAIDMDSPSTLDFYVRDLGLRINDVLDPKNIPGLETIAAQSPKPLVYFTSPGSDHHTVVLVPRQIGLARRGQTVPADITNGQISFQVSSLREITQAKAYLEQQGITVPRIGRDMPGSNWHMYFQNSDFLTVELYYGMEQAGWTQRSKPLSMYYRRVGGEFTLPQDPEYTEVEEALARGLDITAGFRHEDPQALSFDVGGIRLPRPFRIHRLGPVGFFVRNLKASADLYSRQLGLEVSEAIDFEGQSCAFLRCGTDHHCLALYSYELRDKLGLTSRSSNFFVGFELGGYDQLVAAGRFLKSQGWQVNSAPWPELHPGIDRALHVTDPEGNIVLLYYYMEQIGWDGRPSGTRQTDRTPFEAWPDTTDGRSDVFCDASLMGPLG